MEKVIGIVVLLLASIARLYAGDTLIAPADKSTFQMYLCMGQSNMVGVAYVEAPDTGLIPRVYKADLTASADALEWQSWHWTSQDIGKWGMGMTMPFGRYLTQQDQSITVGLINTAVGSTSINDWSPSSYLYSSSVARAKQAMKVGVLAGVIWNQGDTDAHMVGWADSVAKMIRAFRTDVNLPKLPWIVGQIMPSAFDSLINFDVVKLGDTLPYTDWASSDSLTSWAGDPCGGCHFSPASYRTFGIRYAEKMIALQAKIAGSTTNVVQPQKSRAMSFQDRSAISKMTRYDLRGRAITSGGQSSGHISLMIVRQSGSAPVKMAIGY